MFDNEDELLRSARHRHACDAIEAGIEAATPRAVLDDSLDVQSGTLRLSDSAYQLDAFERVLVVGGGNGAGHVASTLESLLGERIDGGIVVTDNPAETTTIDVVEGTHPLPSPANVDATSRLLDRAAETTADDLVLVVLTGGGSALLCAPADGISLSAYRSLTRKLLESGATIDEINAVRKHLSAIKGGQLARALAPARTVGIVFSDVVGNHLDVIASGPTAPDPSTYADARDVLKRYDIGAPERIVQLLEDGSAGNRQETPGSEATAFDHVTHHIVADNRTAIEAAATTLSQVGYETVILSDRIEGEATEIAGMHAQIALACAETGEPFSPPVALLSGGEATVTVDGDGEGGPNQEFALRAAMDFAGSDVVVASVDTDGIDGSATAAGGLVDGSTVDEKARAAQALADNDSFGYLDERDSAIRTGSTGTNINDLRLFLVGSL